MPEHRHAEPTPGPTGPGTVMVDVGGTNGAAVVVTPAALDGAEIEVRPADGPWDGTHTAVRRRDLPDAVLYAGVFGSLPEGRYQLRRRSPDPERAVPGPVVDLVVTAGRIAQVRWPETPAVAVAPDLTPTARSLPVTPGAGRRPS